MIDIRFTTIDTFNKMNIMKILTYFINFVYFKPEGNKMGIVFKR
jgi:hypothetical protein